MTRYTARRTPRNLAGSGWYEILPPPGPARELDRDITADWVIVGAGFAGLAAARRLAQLRGGDRIVVLDAQPIAWGSAGRNTGFMIDLPHELNSDSYAGAREEDLRQIKLNRAAIEFTRQTVAEFGLNAYFSPCGKYHGAADRAGVKALDAFARHLDTLGEPYTHLDAEGMRAATGTGFYAGGIHAPGAALVQPAGYIRGLADSLRGRVEIYENSPAVRIDTGTERAVHTPRGRVSAGNIILTVNGHLESFGLYERRLMHVYTFASMTRPLTAAERERLGGAREWGLIPADPMGSTVRRTADDRIVVRNTFTYNPGMETSRRQVARIGRVHDRSFAARFPMLEGVEMAYRWGGHLCLSLNSAPAFGQIEDGLYSACCQNGLGTVKGTLAGMLAADLATGSNNPLLADMLAYPQPSKLYPEPLMTLGARAKLWWMHRRAGRDL